jgi:FkbM family methyltransferase
MKHSRHAPGHPATRFLSLAILHGVVMVRGSQLRHVISNSSNSSYIPPVYEVVKGYVQKVNSTARRTAAPPCQCEPNNPSWKPTSRTEPKCVFIDLGAANANSFQEFLAGKYGPVTKCPSGGKWEAFLVEANPKFKKELDWAAWKYPGMVHAYSSTAAYSCKGTTSFSIDPDVANNHWGSSMKRSTESYDHDGSVTITVPTLNVNQLIFEQLIPGDWAMLKVDIEGAEYDLIPCLALSSHVHLLDRMYVEEHWYLQNSSVYTPTQYEQAKTNLKGMGVDIPADYFSHTML